ncbi:RlpA-like double-psi beta-barrel-protein domain-containing protein-containing protein [Cokeromyces recurvatus]|uniref:RlpA-like double-psi beta-barrel-protein domain-containing protein-containing protein n=1 Tax=Cokeromyces recurvatus TaxID=90255 RepID=UPI00221F6887|nr:RlpA-like double-psi beta-barrel-protein domain-containing protein-containing protein [Cokeromyces recurvatus]KAI7902825.1 RlpA-like double-psi beta-barrel-protein domain-containing protein-containing protein [Cokeromyces recurvatus]
MLRITSIFMIIAALLAFFTITQAAVIEKRGSYSGHATFYSVKKSGKPSCGGKYNNNDLVVALSHKRMPKGHGKPCGKKIRVKGPKGSVRVKVVDTCAGCSKNHIDLSPKAFEKIAKKKTGRVDVTWSFE